MASGILLALYLKGLIIEGIWGLTRRGTVDLISWSTAGLTILAFGRVCIAGALGIILVNLGHWGLYYLRHFVAYQLGMESFTEELRGLID